MTLHKGTFEIDTTALNEKTNGVSPSVLNKATCSFAFTVTGPVTIFNGGGAYKGIHGVLTVTENFGAVEPLYTSGKNKGQCNLGSSAKPLG